MPKRNYLPLILIALGVLTYYSVRFDDQSYSFFGITVSSEAARAALVRESLKAGFCLGLLVSGLAGLLFSPREKVSE